MGLDDEYDWTTQQLAEFFNISVDKVRKIVKLLRMTPHTIPNRKHRWIFCDDDMRKVRVALVAEQVYNKAIEEIRQS